MNLRRWALAATVALAMLPGTAGASRQPLTLAPREKPGKETLSPEVRRVLRTYDQLMQANMEAVTAGGKVTGRMQELEKRMAREVAREQPQLQVLLATGDRDQAAAAAYALHHAPDPQPAVRSLVAALDRFDGGLANNICLALNFLIEDHPGLDVPLAPLERTMAAKKWTSQQKAAQVVEVMAWQRKLRDPDGSLSAVL